MRSQAFRDYREKRYLRWFEPRRRSRKDLRAARANRVFCTDEKRIRAENTVMDKNSNGMG